MRKGLTLIELLIVVTIIAILAGAAIPYVQEYVEDAKISRCKADLDEIKNALIRFELDKGIAYQKSDISDLVGPYLQKALIDPWGTPYRIATESSVVYSCGPNRIDDMNVNSSKGDDIAVEFRPPFALTKVYWIDADNSGSVNSSDQFQLRFSRPVSGTLSDANQHLAISRDGVTTSAFGTNFVLVSTDNRTVTIELGANPNPPIVPGRDNLAVIAGNSVFSDQATTPYGPNACRQNLVVIQSLQ